MVFRRLPWEWSAIHPRTAVLAQTPTTLIRLIQMAARLAHVWHISRLVIRQVPCPLFRCAFQLNDVRDELGKLFAFVQRQTRRHPFDGHDQARAAEDGNVTKSVAAICFQLGANGDVVGHVLMSFIRVVILLATVRPSGADSQR
jgi:hypothetical protein